MKRDAKMKSMTTSEIRASFLEFFRKNGHRLAILIALIAQLPHHEIPEGQQYLLVLRLCHWPVQHPGEYALQ